MQQGGGRERDPASELMTRLDVMVAGHSEQRLTQGSYSAAYSWREVGVLSKLPEVFSLPFIPTSPPKRKAKSEKYKLTRQKQT